MDAPSTPPDVYARSLRDLARLNAATFTHRTTLRWIDALCRDLPPERPLRVLDVACGYGDLLRAIARRARRAGRTVILEGIDLNPRATTLARAATPDGMPIRYHTGDVFAATPEPRPDVIVCSQFTHHLTDAELVRFLTWLEANAALGWCIVDLHRHWIPHRGFPLLARAAGWHRIVREDGRISIARGFRAAEWRAALAAAQLPAEVRWVFPFRHRIARRR